MVTVSVTLTVVGKMLTSGLTVTVPYTVVVCTSVLADGSTSVQLDVSGKGKVLKLIHDKACFI